MENVSKTTTKSNETRRILLTLAYDGTGFSGFARQKGEVRTVESVVDKALLELTGEEILISGASRTDAGVHALGNLAVFDTDSRIPPERFAAALNARLPEDVRIRDSRQVPPAFHPRFTDTIKRYEYRVAVGQTYLPTQQRYVHSIRQMPDIPAMQRAAQFLVGEHDFTSFASVYMQADSPVRTVSLVEVREESPGWTLNYGSEGPVDPFTDGRLLTIAVEGNGFLYNMVRIMAGTLLEVGRGRFKPEEVGAMLEARDRRASGPTAPARGLTLVGYRFLHPEELVMGDAKREVTSASKPANFL